MILGDKQIFHCRAMNAFFSLTFYCCVPGSIETETMKRAANSNPSRVDPTKPRSKAFLSSIRFSLYVHSLRHLRFCSEKIENTLFISSFAAALGWGGVFTVFFGSFSTTKAKKYIPPTNEKFS